MPKPSLPQGTRDFAADTVRKRMFIFNTIRKHFELFGFQPLETPAMENLDTLMGKYGEEGDKLIFKILNNGLERPEKHAAARSDFEKVLEGKNVKSLTERALRYDLTIPFARYVAMNHGQLSFPFKRYQMQPVWRADRPQKGRYREFYQCDADVVGSQSLLNEIELIQLYANVFAALGLKVEIRINHRQILMALAIACGDASLLTTITTAIDKLDKIGLEKVKEELQNRGLNSTQIALVEKYLNIAGSDDEKINALTSLLGDIDAGKTGIDALTYIRSFAKNLLSADCLVTDFTLARGLNYYTGTIIEVKALNATVGSIGGGGRYDDLTGLFDIPNIPGVGISFGVDRIYDVMEEQQLFPKEVQQGTTVLFFNLGQAESKVAYTWLQALRQQGIAAEIYPEASKMDKQFKYAEKKGIPFTAIIGSNELENGTCVIKNLQTGLQETIPQPALLNQWPSKP